jgi:hypothetical protein
MGTKIISDREVIKKPLKLKVKGFDLFFSNTIEL